MIGRLRNGEGRPGGEAYRRAAADILAAETELSNGLDAQGRRRLEELGDAYGTREQAAVEAAFREGFCTAALLAGEVLAFRDGLPEDQ